jgi:hypothetical protein
MKGGLINDVKEKRKQEIKRLKQKEVEGNKERNRRENRK